MALRSSAKTMTTPPFGVLAYGSLVGDPGCELAPLITQRIETLTPFPVEFARKSSTRGGAPTLVPVPKDGGRVRAEVLVVSPSVTLEELRSIVWRRETRSEGSGAAYPKPHPSRPNGVEVESLARFEGISVVLYTRIVANAQELTPDELAESAIESVGRMAGQKVGDGIEYLINAKANGIETPKSILYEAAILRLTSTDSLDSARSKVLAGLQNAPHVSS